MTKKYEKHILELIRTKYHKNEILSHQELHFIFKEIDRRDHALRKIIHSTSELVADYKDIAHKELAVE